jgi:cystathionine gamma-synthase
MSRSERPEPGTLAVWAGEETSLMQGFTQVPVVHSVSFGYEDIDEWLAVGLGQKPGHIYGRNTNPTVQVFEEKVRQLGIEETDDLITDLRQALDQE